MQRHQKEEKAEKNVTEVNTFPVPFTSREITDNIKITTNASQKQLINQALKFHAQGNILEAKKYYQYCLKKGFNDHRIFCNYGIILRGYGKLKEAEYLQRKAIELKPDFANAYINLGNILQDLGNLQEAEVSARKAIGFKPNSLEAHLNLGNILQNRGKLREAEETTRKAISLKPTCAEAYLNLGVILKDLDKLEEAQLSTRKVIELKPDLTDAYFNLFKHYEQINNLKKLDESIKEFIHIDHIKNELKLFQARLAYRNKENKTAYQLINSISNQWVEESNNSKKILFWSYKAFIEEKLGNYDSAYIYFTKSQEDLSYAKFRKNVFFNYISSYKKNIIHKRVRSNSFNDGIQESNLSFLIGFPRSGTTLLDTILRSHPKIEVIEEKPIISNLEKYIKKEFNITLDNLYVLSDKNIMMLRKKYYESVKNYTNKQSSLIIDKLPLNVIRLPLIKILFPHAKIIFTHRHPYDTVLSCFQQSFKPNLAMANLVSLRSSSKMYDQVMEAWNIYKNNLSLNLITSKYEDLIEDFEDHILKILIFLGVEWDENIKNYRKTALDRDKINTPSSSQVIQPLYKSSIKKWKNYEKYFADCHQYLENWISYFDY